MRTKCWALPFIFPQALQNGNLRQRTKTKKCAKGKTVGPNECAIEAMAAYSEKTNRWERDVLTAGTDPVFEAVMKISKKHAAPLQHLRHFLLKTMMGKLLQRMVPI